MLEGAGSDPSKVRRHKQLLGLKQSINEQRRLLHGTLKDINKKRVGEDQENFFKRFLQETNQIETLYQMSMLPEERNYNRYNVLLILDDCVGQIKELQNNQYLAQLIFNRRHLIANGTLSIVILS